jgi:hypothetical protein
MDTDLKRVVGRGTRDEAKMGGRGSCRAEMAANGDWRLVNDFSGEQCSCTAEKFRCIRSSFRSGLEGRAPAQPFGEFSRHGRSRALQFFAE